MHGETSVITCHRMCRSTYPLLVLLVLMSGISGVTNRVGAQERPVENFEETVAVELVNVEVRVVDKSGNPVTGLSADDFQVFHDGEAVPVSNFTEFRDGSPYAGAGGDLSSESGQTEVAADHHVVVYIDELHLQASNRGAVIEELRRFISDNAIAAENVMIISQGRMLNIEASFGSSEEDLNETLKELAKAAPGLGSENATQQALEEIQRTWNQSRDSSATGEEGSMQIPGAGLAGGGVGGSGSSPRDVTMSSGALSSGNMPPSCNIFRSRVEAILSSWMRARADRISVTLASLVDSSSYLAALPGAKSLVYISDALEVVPGQALSNYADTICPSREQNLAMNTLGEEIDSSLMALTRHAAANQVTIYSIQGSSSQASSSGTARDRGMRAGSIASFDASRRASDQSGLIMLAEETGGRAVLSQNDYGQAFGELRTEMLSFYSLAYQPPINDSGPEHRIEVRMRDTELVARYRRGYMEKSQNKRFSESLQGALNLGLVDNPLEVKLGAGDYRGGGEGLVVLPLQVVIPVSRVSFVPRGEDLMARVVIRVLSRNLENGQVTRSDKSFQVKHEPDSEGQWMQLPMEIESESGLHLLAVGVLDQESGVTSLMSTTVEIPSL